MGYKAKNTRTISGISTSHLAGACRVDVTSSIFTCKLNCACAGQAYMKKVNRARLYKGFDNKKCKRWFIKEVSIARLAWRSEAFRTDSSICSSLSARGSLLLFSELSCMPRRSNCRSSRGQSNMERRAPRHAAHASASRVARRAATNCRTRSVSAPLASRRRLRWARWGRWVRASALRAGTCPQPRPGLK